MAQVLRRLDQSPGCWRSRDRGSSPHTTQTPAAPPFAAPFGVLLLAMASSAVYCYLQNTVPTTAFPLAAPVFLRVPFPSLLMLVTHTQTLVFIAVCNFRDSWTISSVWRTLAERLRYCSGVFVTRSDGYLPNIYRWPASLSSCITSCLSPPSPHTEAYHTIKQSNEWC